MFIIYQIFTSFIYFIIRILKYFSADINKFIFCRDEEKKMIQQMPEIVKKVIWLHGSSVGELDQCKALADQIKKCDDSLYIIQSVFSASVAANNLKYPSFDFTFHLPLDVIHAYDHIFNQFKPEKIIIMAWDTWPNLLLSARKYGAKIYLASATINAESGRLKGINGRFTKQTFQLLEKIFPANEILKPLFMKLVKPEMIGICGDTRFDSVVNKIVARSQKNKNPLLRKNMNNLKNITKATGNNNIIFASTYRACDEIILSAIKKLPDYNVWIFPHKINPERINEIKLKLESMGIEYAIFSEKKQTLAKVIIFDVLGILAYAYQFAKLAYVGGAIHHRVHNVIEPAYFGLPIITGKKIFNSPEAQELQALGGLQTIATETDFYQALLNCNSPKVRKKIRNLNHEYVLARTGYAKKLCKEII